MERLLAMLPILFAGCSSLAVLDQADSWQPADWNQFAGGPGRAGLVKSAVAPPPIPGTSLSLSGVPVQGSALSSGGIMFVPIIGGAIDMFKPCDPEMRGKISTGGWITGTPVICDSLLIYPLAMRDGYVACYNLASKSVVWERRTGLVETSLLLIGDRVAAAGISGELWCWNVRDTADGWRTTLAGGVYVPPAASDSLIFFACDDGDIHAVSVRDGKTRWRRSGGAAYVAGPVISNGAVVAADRSGTVASMDIADGRVRWTRQFGAPVLASLCSDDASVYVSVSDGRVLRLDSRDGSPLWEHKERALLNAPPILSASHLIFVTARGKLVLLDSVTGAHVWSTELGSGNALSPMLDDCALVVCTNDRTARIFKLSERAGP